MTQSPLKSYKRVLFLFRRDLRLYDNTALLQAAQQAEEILPCFIFTKEQTLPTKNPYFGAHSLQFLLESLEDLEEQLFKAGGHLYLFYDELEKIITTCVKELDIDCVIANRDYTPFSIKRDEAIQALCHKKGISALFYDDALLNPPESVVTQKGSPYMRFTPYYEKASQLFVEKPSGKQILSSSFYTRPIAFSKKCADLYSTLLPNRSTTLACSGGRTEGRKCLASLQEEGNNHLSPHLKYTTLSIREVYHTIGNTWGFHHPLIRSLYWRDFFSSLAFFFPHVFGHDFVQGKQKHTSIVWDKDPLKKEFISWTLGQTGIPIIDAAMRELNTTGWMSNRLRMVVASFLTKDLQVDWRLGENYFAKKLIDYDPAVNNGNWQWVAGTGCDPKARFRRFNPWIQQKKIDPDCVYIKRWVEELSSLSQEEIHALEKK